jgi:hypothetical protein
MLPELIAIIVTLAAGPVAFLALNRIRYHGTYPVGIMDGTGDWVLLPAFNAMAVHYGALGVIFASPARILIAFTIAFVPARIFLVWRKDFAAHDDWTRPELHRFNAAGWYHLAFLFCQLFFIAATMIVLYGKVLLWVPLAAFGVTMAFRFAALSK